jgi:DNA-binding Xre family transcriptional regulator
MTDDLRRQANLLVIASKIDLLMAERVITQAELARRMETDRATVCRVLQGKDMTLSTLCRFLDALDCEIEFKPKPVVPNTVV